MPLIFDTTALALLLAGERNAFTDALEQDHPVAFTEFSGSLGEYAVRVQTATSGSSESIGTGTKTFQLNVPHFWTAGTPVYVTEDGDPEANFMVGVLSADETAEGLATVTVTGATGSGTFTAWTIRVLHSATTVASPPLGIADGGTGASTAAGAVAALGMSRPRFVFERRNDPPAGPVTGFFYIVGPDGSGAWAGHSEEFAIWTGSAWTFEDASQHDLAVVSFERMYTGATGRFSVVVFVDGAWTSAVQPAADAATFSSNTEITATGFARNAHIFRKTGTDAVTLTLPATWGGAPGLAFPIYVGNNGASGNVTVNVAGAGTIDGAASATVTPGAAKGFFFLAVTGKWATL